MNMNLPKKEILDLMQFKMEIAREWLSASVKNKRPLLNDSSSSSEDNPEPVRKVLNYRTPIPSACKVKDKYDHWPVVDDLKTARNCRKANCQSRTRVRCSKCKIYLCLTAKNTCFRDFHQ
jgi:hypothetical protein